MHSGLRRLPPWAFSRRMRYGCCCTELTKEVKCEREKLSWTRNCMQRIGVEIRVTFDSAANESHSYLCHRHHCMYWMSITVQRKEWMQARTPFSRLPDGCSQSEVEKSGTRVQRGVADLLTRIFSYELFFVRQHCTSEKNEKQKFSMSFTKSRFPDLCRKSGKNQFSLALNVPIVRQRVFKNLYSKNEFLPFIWHCFRFSRVHEKK